MKLAGTSIIGDRRAPSVGPLAHSADPRTGATLQPGYAAICSADLDAACQLAAAAAPIFARSDARCRAALLRDIGNRLRSVESDFVAMTTRETGLPEARIRGELARTIGQLAAFADEIETESWRNVRIDHAQPDRVPPKPDLRSQLEAIGPVAVFCASNFPLAFSVAGGDTASALAAGCPVIVKAHALHPITAEIAGMVIAQAVAAAGLPAGVFSLIYGPGQSVGQALVRHPAIRAVGFTGSESGGRALMDAAVTRPEPIPVFAEMGSLNPVFVFPGALARDASGIASALHQSIVNGVGQFCTCPGLLIVLDGPQRAEFVKHLTALLAHTASAPMLSLSGAQKYRSSVHQVSSQRGVAMLVAGESDAAMTEPSLLQADPELLAGNAAIRHEMFGPASIVSVAKNIDDMLQIANQLSGQLTATVWAEESDWPQLPALLDVLKRKAGRVLFNAVPTGVEVCPAQTHGGPYPASSDARFSAVGTTAIFRWLRPVSYQGWPASLLPPTLRDGNPAAVWRMVDGKRFAPGAG